MPLRDLTLHRHLATALQFLLNQSLRGDWESRRERHNIVALDSVHLAKAALERYWTEQQFYGEAEALKEPIERAVAAAATYLEDS